MHLGLSMQLNLHYSCQAKCGGLSPRFVTVIDGIVALFANCSTLNSLPFLITLLIDHLNIVSYFTFSPWK